MSSLLLIFTLLVMIVGLVGAAVPLLPGPWLIWLAALLYNLIEGFNQTSTIVFLVLTSMTLIAVSAEWLLSGWSARWAGASLLTVALALLAGIVGLLVLPLVGAILLPPAVVLALEYSRRRDLADASRAGAGYLAGWALSAALEVAFSLMMIGLFILQILVT